MEPWTIEFNELTTATKKMVRHLIKSDCDDMAYGALLLWQQLTLSAARDAKYVMYTAMLENIVNRKIP